MIVLILRLVPTYLIATKNRSDWYHPILLLRHHWWWSVPFIDGIETNTISFFADHNSAVLCSPEDPFCITFSLIFLPCYWLRDTLDFGMRICQLWAPLGRQGDAPLESRRIKWTAGTWDLTWWATSIAKQNNSPCGDEIKIFPNRKCRPWERMVNKVHNLMVEYTVSLFGMNNIVKPYKHS